MSGSALRLHPTPRRHPILCWVIKAIGHSPQLTLDFALSPGGTNLSAGEKQALVIARAALSTARVVVLDEITSSLDPAASARALQVVRRELVAQGAAVLLIAHNLDEVALCDEVWVMDRGMIVESGTAAQLLASSRGYAGPGDIAPSFRAMWKAHKKNIKLGR